MVNSTPWSCIALSDASILVWAKVTSYPGRRFAKPIEPCRKLHTSSFYLKAALPLLKNSVTWQPLSLVSSTTRTLILLWSFSILLMRQCNRLLKLLAFILTWWLIQALNSLRPNDAYMRQQINHHWFRQWLVAWPAPSHYLNQCWNIVNLTPRDKLQWNFNRNSRPQCVDTWWSHIMGMLFILLAFCEGRSNGHWTNYWRDSRVTDDLRRHNAHMMSLSYGFRSRYWVFIH